MDQGGDTMKWAIFAGILVLLVLGCATKSEIVTNTAIQNQMEPPSHEMDQSQYKKSLDKKELFLQAEQLLHDAKKLSEAREFESSKRLAEKAIKLALEIKREKLSAKELQKLDDLLRELLECWRSAHEAIFFPEYIHIQPSAELEWELTPEVEQAIRVFLGPRREWLSMAIWRAGLYINRVREILREEGVPEDLAYLPIIESAYSPFAVSPAGAVGAWQFIESTARRYGLTINRWIDERRDVEKSTRAACRYLKDLRRMFGSWQLALAAYNCGEGRVGQALSRVSLEEFKYSDLPLPYETRNYVPAFFAVLAIVKYPDIFGFQPLYSEELKVAEIELERAVDLEKLSPLLGLDYQELKLLNPELLGKYTPMEGRYKLKVPQSRYAEISEKFSKLAPEQIYLAEQQISEIKTELKRVVHKVKKGETLSKIAQKYKVSILDLKKWNPKVARKKYISPGDTLIIYMRASK